jgi:hypothetical protein
MPIQTQLNVTRSSVRFLADKRRVITRSFVPTNTAHLKSVLDRILGLSELEVSRLLSEIIAGFSTRHRDVLAVFEAHYNMVSEHLDGQFVSRDRRRLIGAYFTKEYAVEAAALFNPSMVPHPDQSGLSPGECRIIVSLRATGEGHISSIGFRSGVIDAAGEITMDPAGRYVSTPEIVSAPIFDKHTFDLKLSEMGIHNDTVDIVLENLPPQFTAEDLGGASTTCADGASPLRVFAKPSMRLGGSLTAITLQYFPRTARSPSVPYFPSARTKAAESKTPVSFAFSATGGPSPILQRTPHSMDSKSCRR